MEHCAEATGASHRATISPKVRCWHLPSPHELGNSERRSNVYTIYCVRLVHILSIAVWFGPKLLVPLEVRRAIGAGPGVLTSAVRGVDLVQKVTITASMVTLASGLGMIFLFGGFGAVPARIHIGFGMTLAIFGVGAFGVDKAWKRIREAATAGRPKADLERLERRLSHLMTVENVLWLAVLVLMVVPLGQR